MSISQENRVEKVLYISDAIIKFPVSHLRSDNKKEISFFERKYNTGRFLFESSNEKFELRMNFAVQ